MVTSATKNSVDFIDATVSLPVSLRTQPALVGRELCSAETSSHTGPVLAAAGRGSGTPAPFLPDAPHMHAQPIGKGSHRTMSKWKRNRDRATLPVACEQEKPIICKEP